MTFEYEILFRIDLGKAIPVVGELMERLNADIASAGGDEKLKLTSEALIPPMTVTVNRELTQEEQAQMREIILNQVREEFPKFDVHVATFRRKSGNAQQSIA